HAAALAKHVAPFLVEPGDVRAGGADAERVRLPPVLERLMRDAHREERLLDVAQSRGAEQPLQVALVRADEPPLVVDVRLGPAGGPPEDAQRPFTAAVIPDAACDNASRTRYAPHLRDAGGRVRHEVDDELRYRRVEPAV